MTLLKATGILAGTYLIGAVIALAAGLGGPAEVLGNGTRLSAPSFIVVAELLGALAARRSRAGALVVLLASGLSLAAAAFDGDVGHAGLTPAQVAWQGVEVAASAVVFALAAYGVSAASSRRTKTSDFRGRHQGVWRRTQRTSSAP